MEDVNDNCDFETEDEVKDDFSYHQFQDVVLASPFQTNLYDFSLVFKAFCCLLLPYYQYVFFYDYWRHLSKTRETEVDALALRERVTLVRADTRLPVPLADHQHHHNDDHYDDYHHHH